MSSYRNNFDETFMYGMDYGIRDNVLLINKNQHNDTNSEPGIASSVTKDVNVVIDNKNNDKKCIWYRIENFEHVVRFYEKYFCILNGSFPKFPCCYANNIYETSTLKRWMYAQQHNDGCLDTDYCRNPKNGVFKLYDKPIALSLEERSNYLSMLSEYNNCSASRIRWLEENPSFHMPKRNYAYNV